MDLYRAPVNTFVAQFLGSPKVNLLPFTWDAPNHRICFDGNTSLACDELGLNAAQAEHGAQLGVRPEAIRLCDPDASRLHGLIEFTEQLGDATIVYLRLPWLKELVTAKLGQQATPLRMGDSIGLQVDASQLMVFDSQGKKLLPA